MESENPSGADNQQETRTSPILELDPLWVVEFVDSDGRNALSDLDSNGLSSLHTR